MKQMNDVDVIINNKKYTICGYESQEYLQKVASYINNKYEEFRKMDGYGMLDTEMKNILLEINIADDYFKTIDQLKELEEELDIKNNEIFDMKHEMIKQQSKENELEEKVKELERDWNEAQKTIVRLETEQKNRKK